MTCVPVVLGFIIMSGKALLFHKNGKILDRCGNDPSAGSPTETLLRLHLPLNDKV